MLKRVICCRSDRTQQAHLPLEPGDDGLRIKTEGTSHLERGEAPLFRGTVNRHGTYLKQVCHFRHFERPLSLLQIFNQDGYGFFLHSRFTSLDSHCNTQHRNGLCPTGLSSTVNYNESDT